MMITMMMVVIIFIIMIVINSYQWLLNSGIIWSIRICVEEEIDIVLINESEIFAFPFSKCLLLLPPFLPFSSICLHFILSPVSLYQLQHWKCNKQAVVSDQIVVIDDRSDRFVQREVIRGKRELYVDGVIRGQ